MNNPIITETSWDAGKKLIITHISGAVEKSAIETWEKTFQAALESIPDNGTFKVLVNMYGFEAVDLEAHKRFRGIVPVTLAGYGWKVGYVDLFPEEAKTMKYTPTRGIQCVGAAHVHQDSTKMDLYNTRFGRDTERFFTDPDRAREWIESI
ncbi:hypothetical protein [Salmonirosea aquatica]|uniref:STAS/SEC14 domain-containing protein n=1 Tax=Salmonirosea aquatica TaxID=2654236 RepID=A0A7C9BJE9_9BACT|nr:hypothetical protein [Cytophagaceae bacterium SJW1-29]